jgi:hypothetical protein
MWQPEMDTPANRERGEKRFRSLDSDAQARIIKIIIGDFHDKMCYLGSLDADAWARLNDRASS